SPPASLTICSHTFTSTFTVTAVLSATLCVAAVTVIRTPSASGGPPCFSLMVTDFALSASPGAVTIGVGGTASSTISVTGLGGFSGIVTLSSAVAPVGPTCTLTPSSVTLPPDQTSALSCTGFTAAGTFTVNLNSIHLNSTHGTTSSVAFASYTYTLS